MAASDQRRPTRSRSPSDPRRSTHPRRRPSRSFRTAHAVDPRVPPSCRWPSSEIVGGVGEARSRAPRDRHPRAVPEMPADRAEQCGGRLEDGAHPGRRSWRGRSAISTLARCLPARARRWSSVCRVCRSSPGRAARSARSCRAGPGTSKSIVAGASMAINTARVPGGPQRRRRRASGPACGADRWGTFGIWIILDIRSCHLHVLHMSTRRAGRSRMPTRHRVAFAGPVRGRAGSPERAVPSASRRAMTATLGSERVRGRGDRRVASVWQRVATGSGIRPIRAAE